MTWYLYVNDPAQAPASIAQDYGRVGALVSEARNRSSDIPGCTWVELDPTAIQDPKWDEATQTLVDSGARFIVRWRDFWNRWTYAEQDALFDLAETNANANKLLQRIRMNLSDPEAKQIDLNSAEGREVVSSLVNTGVLTQARADEIKGS